MPGHVFKKDLAGKGLHLFDDALQFPLVGHRLF